MRTLFLLLWACGEDAPSAQAPVAYDPHPEPPTIRRDVHKVDDDAQFTEPYVPAHRTTMDGRVGVRVQGGPPGTALQATQLSFYLFAPERLTGPATLGEPGPTLLADPEGWHVPFPPALEPGVVRLGHHAICDPTPETPAPGVRPNPYACGDGYDCYDLVVLSSTSTGISAQLWGTPVTVQVAAPKTADAHLVDVRLGTPVAGMILPFSNELTEPAITSDGRLLTARLGRFPRSWTHPETGKTFIRPYDLAYAQLPPDAAPCDVTAWTQFHPMSHAPYDPAMVGTYGLAAYPFRDSEGAPIPDGEDLGGTYPWVDREGANVFMTGVHGRIVEQSTTRYPRRCVTPGCEAYGENTDWDRGYLVAGLWTHGKFVHLDGGINHLDWAVGVTPGAHWEVDLYRDAAGAPVPVRLGAGRFIDSVRAAGGPYPDGYTHNANILDSLQNLLTHHPAGRPVTVRDVVWVMSSGVSTSEVVFDDLLDPDALIVANMQASITQLYDDAGHSLAIPYHHNGQVRRLDGFPPIQSTYDLAPDADEDIHLQNGATSLRWNVPTYGLVPAGVARVEPAALGGVEGRGFWLSGDVGVTFAMPAQPRAPTAMYVGLHLDGRADDPTPRDVLTFPDGTGLRLRGPNVLEFTAAGATVHIVTLAPVDGWRHLGVRVGASIEVLIDGFPVDRFVPTRPLLQVPPGDLVVGRAGAAWTGFRGWIDQLLLLAHPVDAEVACNHAGGTLVRVADAPGPTWAHAEIAAAANLPADARFACHRDPTRDLGAHLGNLPPGAESVRNALHFPEGPLRHGQPRPDSSTNPFCLSCHVEEGKGGLTVDALRPRPDVAAEDDPRRQPMQPPPRVYGQIPAGWIAPGPGEGGPAEALVAPPEGVLIDRWLLPR